LNEIARFFITAQYITVSRFSQNMVELHTEEKNLKNISNSIFSNAEDWASSVYTKKIRLLDKKNQHVVAAYLLTRNVHITARIYMYSNLRRRGEETLQMVLE
jgi:hypothetical protein